MAGCSARVGTFSAVVERDPLTLAITPSGAFKGDLTPERILQIDAKGAVVGGDARPSAEALLHVEIVKAHQAAAVFHTHSVWGTVLSDLHASEDGLLIEGYEMLKGLAGVTTHAHGEWLPIIENDQDMPRLASVVAGTLAPASRGARVPPRSPRFVYVGRDDRGSAPPRRNPRIPPPGSRPDNGLRQRSRAHSGAPVMAVIKVPAENVTLTDQAAVSAYLAACGIDYERWTPAHESPPMRPPKPCSRLSARSTR